MAAGKVVLLAAGSTGDVVPFVALAIGLRAAGFQPVLVTHARFSSLAERYGLACVPVGVDPMSLLQEGAAHPLLHTGANPLALGLAMRQLLDETIEAFLTASLPAMADAQLILASDLAMYVAASIGEKLGIPVVPALLHPTNTNPHHRNPFVALIGGNGIANRLSHELFWHGTWVLFRPMINRVRQSVLHLPPLPARSPFPGHRGPALTLYGFSAAVVPMPAGDAEGRHMTGYWFMPRTPDEAISPPLRAFVESGAPPVCIGFGSMTDAHARDLTALALAAAQRSQHRVVLLGGWAGLGEEIGRAGQQGQDVFTAAEAPHDWLFPRMAAVVHHAGAGTTAAALRAGRPSVPVPFFGDQFFWARRIRDLGAGADPLPRASLTVDRLARAIDLAAADRGIGRAAAELRDRLAREDGVAVAAAVLQGLEKA